MGYKSQAKRAINIIVVKQQTSRYAVAQRVLSSTGERADNTSERERDGGKCCIGTVVLLAWFKTARSYTVISCSCCRRQTAVFAELTYNSFIQGVLNSLFSFQRLILGSRQTYFTIHINIGLVEYFYIFPSICPYIFVI